MHATFLSLLIFYLIIPPYIRKVKENTWKIILCRITIHMLQLNIKIVDGVYIKSWEKDRKRKRRMLFSVFARKIDRRSIPVSGDLPEQPERWGENQPARILAKYPPAGYVAGLERYKEKEDDCRTWLGIRSWKKNWLKKDKSKKAADNYLTVTL